MVCSLGEELVHHVVHQLQQPQPQQQLLLRQPEQRQPPLQLHPRQGPCKLPLLHQQQ